MAQTKKDVSDFFQKCKEKQEAKKNPPKPYFYMPRESLRKKVDLKQKELRESRKPARPTDYERTLIKAQEAATSKKKKGKGVAQLGEQSQSLPPLIVPNEYGSNVNILAQMGGQDIDMAQLGDFLKDANINLEDVLADSIPKPQVDPYRSYKYGQSLFNPKASTSEHGTQMYMLNKWYLEACQRKEQWILLRIRQHHYFRGDDIIHVNFEELHQLCHRDALDKSLISCYCL